MQTLPVALLQWDESTLTVESFLRYEVWRRRPLESGFSKIARITDISQNFYTDATIRSGEATTYTVTQVQDFAGEEVSSEPATPQATQLDFRTIFIHDTTTPGFYTAIPANALMLNTVQDVAFVQPWSQRRPTSQIGNQEFETFNVIGPGVWDVEDAEWWRAFRTLLSRQVDNGSVYMLRGGRDVGHFVAVTDSGRGDQVLTFDLNVSMTEVRYDEVVE